MKNLFKYALCIVIVPLLSCTMNSDENYIVSNKTSKTIGFFANHDNYVSVNNVVIEPNKEFTQHEQVPGYGRTISGFKVSNLNDTTSIEISERNVNLILDKKLKTKADTIIYNSLSVSGAITYNWVVTDELLSVMTHDERLLAEFPDFYKK